jgi:phospholipase C
MLERGCGFTLVNGQPTETNPDRYGNPVALEHLETKQIDGVPTQSWNASHIQLGSGNNDGFVRSVEQTVTNGNSQQPMGYWTEADIPFYYSLARTFALVDRWYGSCLGQTNPNRRFLISGTADGLVDDFPLSMLRRPPAGTIFDLLTANEIEWRNYHSYKRIPTLLKHLIFPAARVIPRAIRAGLSNLSSSPESELVQTIQFTADLYPVRVSRYLTHVKHMRRFWKDAASGELPPFCIVDPNFDDFSEENPQDIIQGERFAYEVIKAVMEGPAWESTLLIWLSDEHGGYYDHVPPPPAVPPDAILGRSAVDSKLHQRLFGWLPVFRQLQIADAAPPRTYDQLGFRVPAVIVSPYARPGWVTSKDGDSIFDHTAVLRLIEEKWNLPAMTKRDLDARGPGRGNILDCLDFNADTYNEPRPLALPKLESDSGIATKLKQVLEPKLGRESLRATPIKVSK